MAHQQTIGDHTAQLRAHDHVLENLGRTMETLSKAVNNLSTSVTAHHVHEQASAEERKEQLNRMERATTKRQWALGTILGVVITLHDHILKAVAYVLKIIGI